MLPGINSWQSFGTNTIKFSQPAQESVSEMIEVCCGGFQDRNETSEIHPLIITNTTSNRPHTLRKAVFPPLLQNLIFSHTPMSSSVASGGIVVVE
jgi:hypothetical protein